MPRKYEKKRKPNYDHETLLAAVDKVAKLKLPIYSVAKEFNIPRQTLHRWVRNKPTHIGAGRNTVLKDDEEKLIVGALKFVGNCGLPQSRSDIRDIYI